ncbi:MAG: phenylalanine 4-monooxygenase [Bacteroidetes bacterium OLB10]|nr:MAG: phenylalanine 4-monooxygenase [Bacteroidetes bacterium OLB10]
MIKFTIRVLNLKVVRYFFSAASATVVDVVIYFLAFNYIYHKEDIHLPFYTFSAPTASLALSYTCGLITNFFLTKNLVFKESDLKGHHQFLRFVLVAIGVLFLNYVLMNFFNSSVTLVSYHLTCIFCSKLWCIKFYCT